MREVLSSVSALHVCVSCGDVGSEGARRQGHRSAQHECHDSLHVTYGLGASLSSSHVWRRPILEQEQAAERGRERYPPLQLSFSAQADQRAQKFLGKLALLQDRKTKAEAFDEFFNLHFPQVREVSCRLGAHFTEILLACFLAP